MFTIYEFMKSLFVKPEESIDIVDARTPLFQDIESFDKTQLTKSEKKETNVHAEECTLLKELKIKLSSIRKAHE